jgi:hypothetical protein
MSDGAAGAGHHGKKAWDRKLGSQGRSRAGGGRSLGLPRADTEADSPASSGAEASGIAVWPPCAGQRSPAESDSGSGWLRASRAQVPRAVNANHWVTLENGHRVHLHAESHLLDAEGGFSPSSSRTRTPGRTEPPPAQAMGGSVVFRDLRARQRLIERSSLPSLGSP